MSTWKINTPLKQVVSHSCGITAALTAGMNIDEPTTALFWIVVACVMEYTAYQYNKLNSVNGGWQKFAYLFSWFMFIVYVVAFIGGFVGEILRSL